MLIILLSVSIGLAFFAFRLTTHYRIRRAAQSLSNAQECGVSVGESGNIDARATFANMSKKEESAGERFTGNKARFMELMRVVSAGPKTPDEIRLLLAEGIEPVVRPDGLIYVPCIENEHLSVEGELDLKEEDLDLYIAEGHLQLIPVETQTFSESERA